MKPIKLNNLQARTLTVLQELARHPETSTEDADTGNVLITQFPDPHGNHFHVGEAVVMAANATGLRNESVWKALERKGLARAFFPHGIALTPDGQAFDTGLGETILIRADH
ncbi:MAG: hypothetical protein QGG17_01270 [Rhodospirillales bacterium]|nr:hypothetical protein [Rhodospirillales bacterium]